MTVLDAYAVIAYLRGEPSADEVAELLRGRHAMLSAPPRAENQEAIAASSPDSDDGMDDFGEELKRRRLVVVIPGFGTFTRAIAEKQPV